MSEEIDCRKLGMPCRWVEDMKSLPTKMGKVEPDLTGTHKTVTHKTVIYKTVGTHKTVRRTRFRSWLSGESP